MRHHLCMVGPWTLRLSVSLATLLLGLAGCTADARPDVTPTGSSPENVIDFIGLPGATIGASQADLVAAGVVVMTGPGCGPSFTSATPASPVFAADRLVLIWAYPPLHTPEDVMVGTPLDVVRKTYPTAVELAPPAGSNQYPALLITGPDDLAYLLLHRDGQVEKLVVGMLRYAQMLVDTGFGTC